MNGSADEELVNGVLGYLQSAYIRNLTIDMRHGTLSVQSYTLTSGGEEQEHHTVVFEGVASLYVIQSRKERRFLAPRADRFPGDTEIGEGDGIGFYPNGIGQVRIHARPDSWESMWADDYRTRPNFFLSLGGKVILLEAHLVRIDETAYEVGYPEERQAGEN